MYDFFSPIRYSIGIICLFSIGVPIIISNRIHTYFEDVKYKNGTYSCKFCNIGACKCCLLKPSRIGDVKGTSHYGLNGESHYNPVVLSPIKLI